MLAITQALNQLKSLLASLSPAMRAGVGVALVALVLSGVFWCYQSWGGAYEYLLGGRTFNASEMTAAQAAFAKAKLADAQIEGARIRVPRGAEASYVAAMAEEGVLPDDFHKTLDKALSQLNAFTPPKSQEAMINNARQRALADIIRNMRGIEQAAVLIDRRPDRGFARKELVTASVTVWPQAGHPLEPRTLDSIRRLVQSSVAGLSLESVMVLTDAGVAASASDSPGNGHDYLSALTKHKNEIEATVLAALSFVPQVRVAVNVELHRELESSEETRQASTVKQARFAGLTPKSVTVAVSVPSSYFESIWQEMKRKNESASPRKPVPTLEEFQQAEKAKITQLVASVLPAPADKTSAAPRVHVAEFHYVPPAVPVGPTVSERALAWLGHYWPTVGMFLLAGAALVILRSLLVPSSPRAAPVNAPTLQQPARARRRETKPATLRDELVQIVREDPESAAKILRGWISGTT
jgi:flagellar biosynthesis/type III secretory pathway M-ring protein FliF/YscJ